MNIGIVSVLLKSYCKKMISDLEQYYETPEDKLYAVRNSASDSGNEEIVEICDWIEAHNLTRTFFPETEE